MANNKHPTVPIDHDVQGTPPEELENQQLVLSEQQRLTRIDQMLGMQGEYSFDAERSSAKAHFNQAAVCMLQAARAMLRIKQRESRDTYEKFVLDDIGIQIPYANRICAAFLRFAKRPEVLQLDRAKVLSLMALDDETMDEIVEGNLEDLTLDHVDQMSASELRKKVRELKEDLSDSREKLKAERNEKSDLQDQIEQRDKEMAGKKLRVSRCMGDLDIAHVRMIDALMNWQKARMAIDDAIADTGLKLTGAQIDTIGILTDACRDCAFEAGINRDEQGMYQ